MHNKLKKLLKTKILTNKLYYTKLKVVHSTSTYQDSLNIQDYFCKNSNPYWNKTTDVNRSKQYFIVSDL